MVVGPAAGGMLAERPVTSLFRRYPYALPNLFAAGLALLALCVIEAWLPGKSSYSKIGDEDKDEEEPAPRRACARVPRTSWLPIGVYCFLSTFSIFYEDCYPLWLLTPNKEGGMGYAVDEIGAVLSATAVFTVAYQFLIFPFISERMPSQVLVARSLSYLCGHLRGLDACSRPDRKNEARRGDDMGGIDITQYRVSVRRIQRVYGVLLHDQQ